MKIMVFLHGTTIMHRSGAGQTREARVKQVLDGEESIYDFASYVPIDNAASKLRRWNRQGAEIVYLSSHKYSDGIDQDWVVLRKFGFPEGPILFRKGGETYNQIAERIVPDILIEDDCESIGGAKEMTSTQIAAKLKTRIKLIVVREFEGIDHLPDDLSELLYYQP